VPDARLSSPEAREAGRRLYLESCALCHGERGDGRGARRESLSTKPADFTDSAWRARSSPRRVYHAIREGVPGTPMPSWKSLSSDQTWDLVAFVLGAGEAARSPEVP
jgi:high-affinity iron transporter